MPQKHRSPARATRATFAVLLVAVLLVAGLAAPTGARVASTDFVSIFEHPHPKIGTCFMNLVRVKEGPKDKKPHGNDANDEAAAGRAQTAFGPFRGIRPADVAVAQGYRLCGKQPLPFPPKG